MNELVLAILIFGCAANAWLFEAGGDGANLASCVVLGLVVLTWDRP